jgi:phage host-nuclease inhibitor protein Gam
MQTLAITSIESLESAVAEVVRNKSLHTKAAATRDAEIAALTQTHQANLTTLADQIADSESVIHDYCTAHRAELFVDKKSRDTSLAVFGFELTPWRIETANKKIKWKDVVKRLLRNAWGKVYVRKPAPQPDKEALLADREKLTEAQQQAAGVQFCQDEQFFIRPKPETAAATTKEAN